MTAFCQGICIHPLELLVAYRASPVHSSYVSTVSLMMLLTFRRTFGTYHGLRLTRSCTRSPAAIYHATSCTPYLELIPPLLSSMSDPLPFESPYLLSRLPSCVSRWFGYRDSPESDLPAWNNNIWSWIGAFCELSVIAAIFGHSVYFTSRNVPVLLPSFVRLRPE